MSEDVKKLEKLTPEQEGRLSYFREKWTKIGLATGPVDQKAMEEAVDEAYRRADLSPPNYHIWVGSPLAGCIYAAILTESVQLDERGEIKGDPAEVAKAIREQLQGCGYGQHDANWLAFYDAFKEFGVPGLECLEGLWALGGSGWWWPFEELVIMSPRPDSVSFDPDGRLHHEDQAAILYPDGFGVYCWHGVRVPPWIILHPDRIDVETIRKEQNTEINRVLIERYGYDRYLQDTKAKLVHEDQAGRLWEQGDLMVVEVVNSTPEPDGSQKHYWLPVPNNIRTAHEAVAWTFGFEGDAAKDYHPDVQS